MDKDKIKKVFIFRSCPMDKFLYVLDSIKEKIEGKVEFYVLTSKNSVETLKERADVKEVIGYREEKINLFSFFRYLFQFSEKKFDFLLVPYNHIFGKGYLAIELCSLFIRAKDKKIILFNQEWLSLSLAFLLKKAVLFILDILCAYLLFFVMAAVAVVFKAVNFIIRFKAKEFSEVVFIAHRPLTHPSVKIRCYYFSELLKQKGINTKLIFFNYSADEKTPFFKLLISDTFKMWENFKVFLKLLIKRRALIYLQKAEYHFVGPFLAILANSNQFVFDMDDWEEGFTYFSKFHFLNNKNKIYPALIKKAKKFIVSSHYLAEYYGPLRPDIRRIPSGIYLKNFLEQKREVKGEKEVVVSWIGGICDLLIVENIAFFCSVLQNLTKKGAPVRFEILGEGIYAGQLKGLVKNKYPDLRVEFKGWIEPKEVYEYLGKVDIGICPLIGNDGVNLAKCPVKLFEYMTASLPVIASNMGEAKYIIEDGKNGFLAKDKEEWTNKLTQLVENESLRINMGRAARKTIEEEYDLALYQEELFKAVMG